LIPHHDKPAGIGVWERAQDDGVNDAEDCSICSDAEREREYGGEGEAGGAEEASEGVAEVVQNGSLLLSLNASAEVVACTMIVAPSSHSVYSNLAREALRSVLRGVVLKRNSRRPRMYIASLWT
jgi:hypothetical protein